MGASAILARKCPRFKREDSGVRADASVLLPRHYSSLSKIFTPMRLRYVASVLTDEEIDLIRDPTDALIMARIKRMTPEELRRFDRYAPKDENAQKLFNNVQVSWIKDEEWVVGSRIGHKPSQKELFADFMKYNNGVRYRAYFTMKHPELVVGLVNYIPSGGKYGFTEGRAA